MPGMLSFRQMSHELKQGNAVKKVVVAVFGILTVLFILLISHGDVMETIASFQIRHNAYHLDEILTGFLFAFTGMGICSSVREFKFRADQKASSRKKKEIARTLEKLDHLNGIIPICSCCKRIRDANGTWQSPEGFIHQYCDVQFSHSICPQCQTELYPEYPAKGPET